MAMKIVDQLPKSGQFGVIWVHEGNVWTETWRINNGFIEIWQESPNDDGYWVGNEDYPNGYKQIKLQFVVGQ